MAKKPDMEKWGRSAAKQRYGTASGSLAAKDQQAQQDPESKHEAKYDNDASGWVRGVGKPYPTFDSGPSGNRHK